MQKKMWDSYSPEFKAILEEAACAGRDVCREANMKVEETAIKVFEDAGCKINNADKQSFIDDSQAIYDMFADEIGADLIKRVQDTAKNF